MLYWECKKRLESIRHFRSLVVEYFENIEYPRWPADNLVHNDISRRARTEINQRLGEIEILCSRIQVTYTVNYYQSPVAGGREVQLNLFTNIFELHKFQIRSERVSDVLDRAIGIYENKRRWLLKQMFNPLFWAQWLLIRFLSIPFKLLKIAGFDADTIEKSSIGKVIRILMELVLFIAALLTVLHYLDLLDILMKAVRSRIQP